MTKPPYVLPTMAEIAAVPDCGLRVASTFSGCGGSSLGYEMAGFRVLWANEFIQAAQAVYRLNHPTTYIDTRDIREVAPRDLLAAIGLDVGALDLLDGSPPCASFSMAGNREKDWGKARKYSDTTQRTDDLFFEFARLVEGVQPRVFVAENVGGLVRGVAKGYFINILRRLRACGYRVACRLLDAQWLGVPQARQRVFFVGVREDLQRDPVFPDPLPYRYTVREALPHLLRGRFDGAWQGTDQPSPTVNAQESWGPESSKQGLEQVEARVIHDTGGQHSHGDVTDRPMPTVMTEPQIDIVTRHVRRPGMRPRTTDSPHDDLRFDGYAIDKEWDKLAMGEYSRRYQGLVRPDPNQPSPTICATHGTPGIAGVTHPIEKRKLSIDELKRICSFPADFQLTGTYHQQWERLGRAVPPLMMRALATRLRDDVLLPTGGA